MDCVSADKFVNSVEHQFAEKLQSAILLNDCSHVTNVVILGLNSQ